MIDLALSILCSTLIFVIFKLFDSYKVQTLYAIIVNYFIACAVGLFFFKDNIMPLEIPKKPWFMGALALGILFILVFNVMARTSQQLGVSVASVATKMSLVIPVLLGLHLYSEELNVYKTIGVILALAAVYLASKKLSKGEFTTKSMVLPVLVFLGSGAIDASIKYLETTHVPENEIPLFSSFIFFSACITGVIFVLFQINQKPIKLNFRNVLGGIALGIPNYFSIYYLIRALRNASFTSASIFTMNNVAIVLFSTLIGIIFFKEKMTMTNWGGIVLAIISIILMAKF